MSERNPTVSVVMACRDAAETLAKALQSILRQSLPAEEVILVLNGCRDKSASIAADFAQRDSRIRLFESSPTGGVAEAARLGCANARAPLIARMDADDIAGYERLAAQVASFKNQNADLVTCRIEPLASLGHGIDRYVGWANTLKKPTDFRRERFIESPVIQPGVLMTREAYQRAGGYQVKDGPEDYDLWLRMLQGGDSFYQAEEAVLQWRDSNKRLTRTHDDYSQAQMTATKACYLSQMTSVRAQGVMIAGSGPIGRRCCRSLQAAGVQIHGFFEVAPKKIGGLVLGLPVYGMPEFGIRQRQAVLLGCVGRGGREAVREVAARASYREGEDFFACC